MQPCTKEKEIETMKTELSQTTNLLARIDERQKNHDRILKSIHDQTKKTNGRVTKLEKWRWVITGALIVVGLVIGGDVKDIIL